jgi:hypothetical protein
MATLIECTEGHYETQEASYGATHPWDERYRDWLEWRVIE